MSTAEAEIVRRMHRLRARVAHGEQITLAAGTLDAYHRLAARLLPHYDVLVVGPEDAAAAPPLARAEAEVPPRRRFDDVEAIPPRHTPDGTRTTTRLRRPPPRERTVYPDDDLARYTGRPRRNQGDYAELDSGESQFERLQRTQPWLLPLLIIVSVFLIGAAISISLQQIRAARSISLATATAFAPAVTTISPVPSVNAGATVNNVVPTLTTTVVVSPTLTVTVATPVPGVLAIGQGALVGTEIPLNLRERPGLDPNIPVLMILNPGTEVLVVEGPTSADGLSWWKVRVANLEGWCAGDYLVPR
ncbi:MAG: SH3 domain-containing protein [Oscillochloris sp.]|nr:SH3 domain-containing protein [Oscillochloris sp.]